MKHQLPDIAVIIPTKGRPTELVQAVGSVFAQTLQPSLLVVVGQTTPDLGRLPAFLRKSGTAHTPVVLLTNSHTANLSGALNSGLAYIAEHNQSPSSTFIAFLDDDDRWDPTYLEKCVSVARRKQLDWVVAGIIRHETSKGKGIPLRIPKHLRVEDFLATNPHVQGSNLFVRLSTLTRAGWFDENLESTTDRDVGIRLLDLGETRLGFVNRHLVHHFAIGTDRLSTPGSESKHRGLVSFYQKYGPRMSTGIRAEFIERAVTMFGCSYDDFSNSNHGARAPGGHASFQLVVGFAAWTGRGAAGLFEDLAKLPSDGCLVEVVVCMEKLHDSRHSAWLSLLRDRGIVVRLISSREIRRTASQGGFGEYYRDRTRQKGVAFFRTALHHHLYLESSRFENPVVWILDGDVRLDGPLTHTTLEDGSSLLLRLIRSLKSMGADIAVGGVSGDPPIPGASMLRTQLLDFDFNLKALANPNFSLDREAIRLQNDLLISKYPDFYYDLTVSHSGHLETPFYYSGGKGSIDRLSLLEAMLNEFPLLARGVNIFRPRPSSDSITIDENPMDPTRGGNTFVLNIDCLRDYPNLSPRLGGVQCRRGDTLWSILNKRANPRDRARKVVAFDASVRQDRRKNGSRVFDSKVLLADIYGSAFTRALNEVLRTSKHPDTFDSDQRGAIRLDSKQIALIIARFDERLRERLAVLRANSWRIQGLIDSIENQMDAIKLAGGEEWGILRRHRAKVEKVLARTAVKFSPAATTRFSSTALKYSKAEIEGFLRRLGEYIESYRERLPTREGTTAVRQIADYLRIRFAKPSLRLLALGGEGAIFTDEVRVYKYFFSGVGNFDGNQLDSIARRFNAKQLSWSRHVNPIEDVVIDGSRVVFVSKLVSGTRYSGGLERGMLELLKECRRGGFVLRNISPANLIVKDDSLVQVDIGRSVYPLDEEGYLAMCRRAYLVYRWHFRSDLKDLLRRALTDEGLPELYGFDSFLAALHEMDSHEALDETLLNFLGKTKPTAILDYGCGNGGLADKLAQWGIDVTAHDIDPVRYQGHYHLDSTSFVDKRGLEGIMRAGRKYDTVLCSLVLCSVDDAEVGGILSDLRRLVSDAGSAVVVICNPFDIETAESETHTKSVPSGVSYFDHYTYQKTLKTTRGTRDDYHRPLAWYKTAFRRAGFSLADLLEVRGTDVPRLAPSSDFLILRLNPVRIPEQSDVSLLVKASPMEWRTIGKQVAHIVSQLEFPRLFLERVVVVDDYSGPFARQYDVPNFDKMLEALESLLKDGTIDKVLVAPADSPSLSDIALRWFSINAPVSRSENGQPTMTTLYGLEQCRGRYVMQVDSDCLIFRADKEYDYLKRLLESFKSDPNLVTTSFSIACKTEADYAKSPTGQKWRTEVRCGLLEMERLKGLLPLPNSVGEGGKLRAPWHRALDQRLQQSGYESYRGSDPKAFFIHVPNDRKVEVNAWYNIMKAVEAGRMPEAQYGKVDLVGDIEDWLPPRGEDCVLVIRGRDVPISKLRRCFDSIASQTDQEWGLLVVDAGSVNGMAEYVSEIISPKYQKRLTLYRNTVPATPVENIYRAVHTLCKNPRSIIIMPDADDAFLRPDAIAYTKSEYEKGADLAVGGLLRTDKEAFYPAAFENPRRSRGGNVWQPLRTFRKYLFDAIRPDDLKVSGAWVPHTEDWAVMLPMAEMAKNPVQFQNTIYLYEPSPLKGTLPKDERETLIAKIVSKHPYKEMAE